MLINTLSEEMLDVNIEQGYLYYGKTRHREKVDFNRELRESVVELSNTMYGIIKMKQAVFPEYGQNVIDASLKNLMYSFKIKPLTHLCK